MRFLTYAESLIRIELILSRVGFRPLSEVVQDPLHDRGILDFEDAEVRDLIPGLTKVLVARSP